MYNLMILSCKLFIDQFNTLGLSCLGVLREAPRLPLLIHVCSKGCILEVILETFWLLKFDRFLLFFERVLFGTLGAIRELMGGKVVPKGSDKVSKRAHFETRVDF